MNKGQEVNLYAAYRQAHPQRIQPGKVGLYGGIFVALCILAVVGTKAHETRMSLQLDELLTKQAELKIKQKELRDKLGNFSQDELKKNVAEVEKDLNAKQALHQVVVERIGEGRQNYSRYFVALAQHSKPNMWLEHIYVAQNGKRFVVEGKTWHSRDIAAYLDDLQRDPEFSHVLLKEFETKNLSKPGERNQLLKFTLSTHPILEKEDESKKGNTLAHVR